MKNSEYIFLMSKKTGQYIFMTKDLGNLLGIDLLEVLTVYWGGAVYWIFDYSAGQEEYFGQDY